jgi:hypothetical protein
MEVKMSKKMVVSACLVLLLCITVVSITGAAGLPGSSWWVSYQVQNVDSSAGTLAMSAYTEDNVAFAQYDSAGFAIASGGALTYNPGYPPTYSTGGNRIGFCASASNCDDATDDVLPVGFHGSVVVSSDVNAVAIGMVSNSLNGSVGTSSGHALGSYAGFGGSLASSEMLFPAAKHNFGGFTIAYYVQSAGVDASVTITYTMNDGSIHKETTTIPANRMHMFDPANATPAIASSSCGAAATSPCLGSARIVASSGQVVGVALEYAHGVSPAQVLGVTRGFAPADYSKTILVPGYKYDWYGYWSGLALQNTTGVTATATVTLTVIGTTGSPALGSVYVQTGVTVPPYGQAVISKYRANMGGLPAATAASVIVTADQPLVGVHSESHNTGYPVRLVSYNCYNPSAATNTVALPAVKEYFYGGRLTPHASRSTTSVVVQNAGTVSSTVYLRYTAIGGPGVAVGTVYTVTIGVGKGANGTQLLAPGAAYVFNMLSEPSRAALYAGVGSGLPADNVNYAVTVVSNQPTIALAQEEHKPPTGTTPNDAMAYEGFNLP